MEYADIINDNCENHCIHSWWPKFAYHYTDVTNAASILDSGFLYSRVNAEKMKLMQNDNASRQVIDMTKTEAVANVRFYFRPLTPTQYYNEGFKHKSLRYDNDLNANTPVPVFFLFGLEKLIRSPEVKFSERGQAGFGSTLVSGLDNFQALCFDKIYGDSYVEDRELFKYRRAELLYPNAFNIDVSLQVILCRNDIEKTTLLNLLKLKNSKAFYKYKSIVKVCKEDMFEKNGLFVTDCVYHERTVSISFSNTHAKKYYTETVMRKNGVDSLEAIDARAELEWINAKGNTVYSNETEFKLDYQNTASITFQGLPEVKESKKLRIRLLFEDNLMCFVEQPLAAIELI